MSQDNVSEVDHVLKDSAKDSFNHQSLGIRRKTDKIKLTDFLPPSLIPCQAGDTRIPLPRKSLWTPQKIVDCKVGLCTSLQTVAEFL